jgi:hypothetical protein
MRRIKSGGAVSRQSFGRNMHVQNGHVNPRIMGFFTTWHPRPAGISDVSWTLKDFLNKIWTHHPQKNGKVRQ